MAKKQTMADVLDLSAAERILLAQDLWDSIADEPDAWTLSDAQRGELDRRLQTYRNRTAPSSSWNTVKARIQRKA